MRGRSRRVERGGYAGGRRYRWKASNMRQKFQLPLPSLLPSLASRGEGCKCAAVSWSNSQISGQKTATFFGGRAPALFRWNCPNFCSFMAPAAAAAVAAAPLRSTCEVSVIFGHLPSPLSLSLSLLLTHSLTHSVSHLSSRGLDVAVRITRGPFVRPRPSAGVVGVSQDPGRGDADTQ